MISNPFGVRFRNAVGFVSRVEVQDAIQSECPGVVGLGRPAVFPEGLQVASSLQQDLTNFGVRHDHGLCGAAYGNRDEALAFRGCARLCGPSDPDRGPLSPGLGQRARFQGQHVRSRTRPFDLASGDGRVTLGRFPVVLDLFRDPSEFPTQLPVARAPFRKVEDRLGQPFGRGFGIADAQCPAPHPGRVVGGPRAISGLPPKSGELGVVRSWGALQGTDRVPGHGFDRTCPGERQYELLHQTGARPPARMIFSSQSCNADLVERSQHFVVFEDPLEDLLLGGLPQDRDRQQRLVRGWRQSSDLRSDRRLEAFDGVAGVSPLDDEIFQNRRETIALLQIIPDPVLRRLDGYRALQEFRDAVFVQPLQVDSLDGGKKIRFGEQSPDTPVVDLFFTTGREHSDRIRGRTAGKSVHQRRGVRTRDFQFVHDDQHSARCIGKAPGTDRVVRQLAGSGDVPTVTNRFRRDGIQDPGLAGAGLPDQERGGQAAAAQATPYRLQLCATPRRRSGGEPRCFLRGGIHCYIGPEDATESCEGFLGVGRPVGWVMAAQGVQPVDDFLRYVRRELAPLDGDSDQVKERRQVRGRVGSDRVPSEQRFLEQNAERVEVGPDIRCRSLQQLGRHVVQRAPNLGGGAGALLGHPEVEHHQPGVVARAASHQQVLRFQIPVNQPEVVDERQGVEGFAGQLRELVEPLRNRLDERPAVDVLE